MSGPIVRTGTNPKFWDGWDKIFGDAATRTSKKSPAKATKKSPKKKASKKKK